MTRRSPWALHPEPTPTTFRLSPYFPYFPVFPRPILSGLPAPRMPRRPCAPLVLGTIRQRLFSRYQSVPDPLPCSTRPGVTCHPISRCEASSFSSGLGCCPVTR
jgi:hypothetical protein